MKCAPSDCLNSKPDATAKNPNILPVNISTSLSTESLPMMKTRSSGNSDEITPQFEKVGVLVFSFINTDWGRSNKSSRGKTHQISEN